MANQEHLRILNGWVVAWNKWKHEHEYEMPDLSGANLRGADLVEANLSQADLSRADLRNARLYYAVLHRANLTGADVSGANLTCADLTDALLVDVKLRRTDLIGANLNRSNLGGSDLSGSDLSGGNLSEVNLAGARLSKADLTDTNLSSAKLVGATLSGAHIGRSNLSHSDLSGANLTAAYLRNADLSDADLSGADLSHSDLSEAKLRDANMRRAHLRNANLSNTDLSGASLSGADLAGANLGGSRLSGADLTGARLFYTIFGDVDLSAVKGLHAVNNAGPSTIGTDTFAKSKARIPEVFLKGCGLADWQIEFSKLHRIDLTDGEIVDILYSVCDLRASRPIQISPLFISYSHDDAAFVDRMEATLDQQGTRYWRDTRHAIAGPLESQVDRAMRVNPTVLLVLSKSSVGSDWVAHEVNLARQLEKEKKKHVLCPVALDDSWKTCSWEARLMEQIMKYNILDFSNWQDDQFFSRQFQKLKDGLQIFY